MASRVFSATPPSVPARRAGPDVGLRVHRQLFHPRLVAQDRAAGDGGRRVDRQHRHAVALRDQVQPQRLDEGDLAHARHAADAQAERAAGVRQQRGEQRIGLRAVVGAGRLEQRDGLGDGAALRRARCASDVVTQRHGRCGPRGTGGSRHAATARADLLQHVLGAGRDRRAGAVDALHAGVVQEVVVLPRNHAADEHDDVVGALLLAALR